MFAHCRVMDKKDDIKILSWRVQRAIPFGFHVWFDPDVEQLRLYQTPCPRPPGSEKFWKKVDKQGELWHTKEYVSVSASRTEDEPNNGIGGCGSSLKGEDPIPF